MTRFNSYRRKEISLRDELIRTLDGSASEISKAYDVLVRRMRVDSSNRLIKCKCHENGTGQMNPPCKSCLGEGYLWDEEWIEVFKDETGSESAKSRRMEFEAAGQIKGKVIQFYCRYDANIKKSDKIVELAMDLEGKVKKPYQREKIWKVHEIEERRADNGRVEFLVVYCSQEIYTWE